MYKAIVKFVFKLNINLSVVVFFFRVRWGLVGSFCSFYSVVNLFKILSVVFFFFDLLFEDFFFESYENRIIDLVFNISSGSRLFCFCFLKKKF